MESAQGILSGLRKLEIGEEYTIAVLRGEEEININAKVFSTEKINKHVFELNEDASKDQKSLRESWMKNQ